MDVLSVQHPSHGATGSDASSEVTHPSAVSTPASSVTSRDIGTLSASKPNQTQLSLNLADYLPLGCLTFDDSEELLSASSDFQEITSASPLLQRARLGIQIKKLLEFQWIRLFALRRQINAIVRVYLLPEDIGRSSISRHSKQLRVGLENLLTVIDASPDTWNGRPTQTPSPFDPWASVEDGSLFYIFNTLPSPAPRPESIRDRHTRCVVEDLLAQSTLPGLKTTLYAYQARAAAAMIQRESSPELHLDPRLEKRTSPTGQAYYYSPRDNAFFRNPQMYEGNRGGILAETMGLGKTIICLAVILATKNHFPRIPPQYLRPAKTRESVPRLTDLAASICQRLSIPAKAHFSRLRQQTGEEYLQCIRAIDDQSQDYFIPGKPPRSNRRTQTPPPKRMLLCDCTIIVVPRNLVHQWKSELRKHTVSGPDGLQVLVMDSPSSLLPSVAELMKYDVVLFSKPRFEREIRDGSDRLGRTPTTVNALCQCPYIGATRIRDCSCLRTDDLYSSPLKEIHWLRIIIDEGHEFSSANSNAVAVARKLVTADRRWVVSGTPARDRLFGVEVDLAADADIDEEFGLYNDEEDLLNGSPITPSTPRSSIDSTRSIRRAALQQRKAFNRQEESSGAAKSIGLLATYFLKARPWAGDKDDRAEWDEYIYRHEVFRGRSYSAFSKCLRQTLHSLVIKTQPDDVERDIVLPPLIHKVVRLDPSFYDKMTANLFVLFLTANAITSERTDVDYLFHKNSAKARYQLITNLRQSNFFWTSFSLEDILSVIDHSTGYLKKEVSRCTPEDRALLQNSIEFAQMMLNCPGWLSLSRTHELGLFVDNWPDDSAKSWSLTPDSADPPMIGVSQLSAAQDLVNDKLFDEEPLSGLKIAGEVAMASLEEELKVEVKSAKDGAKTKMGVPTSGVKGEPSKRHSTVSPRKGSVTSARRLIGVQNSGGDGKASDKVQAVQDSPQKKSRKRKRSIDGQELPEDSILRRPSITGSVSAKLSYLLGRIVELQGEEKILVFYNGDNTAFYIAQCLDLLHVKHLIYAKSLSSEQRSKYIVAFDVDDSIRVLLMDIRSGAFGLNVNKASRVFFINPVCRPISEAQAIKRSHRIGQSRPVHVETLVLRGTIEEKIFERSKDMTRTEHLEASQLSDDTGVTHIIQNATMMPVSLEDGIGRGQMAPFKTPLQIFGRSARGDTKITGIDLDIDDDKKPKRRRKTRDDGGDDTKKEKKKDKKKERGDASYDSIPLFRPTLPAIGPLQFSSIPNSGSQSTFPLSMSASVAAAASATTSSAQSGSITRSIFG